jgi:hypothetical protein
MRTTGVADMGRAVAAGRWGVNLGRPACRGEMPDGTTAIPVDAAAIRS